MSIMNNMELENTVEPESTSKKAVWGFWPTVGFGFGIGVVDFLIQIFITIIYGIILFSFNPSTSLLELTETFKSKLGLSVSFSTLVSSVICIGLIVLAIKLRKNATIVEYLGLRPISKKVVVLVLAIVAGFILVSGSLALVLDRPVPEFMFEIYETSVWPALFWISVVLFVPAFEEVFFRGFLFAGFRHSRIGVIGAVVLTSLIWTLLHIQYGLYELTMIFILGILLGVVRFKTGSLWSPLLMHAFNNLLSTIEISLYVNGVIS